MSKGFAARKASESIHVSCVSREVMLSNEEWTTMTKALVLSQTQFGDLKDLLHCPQWRLRIQQLSEI